MSEQTIKTVDPTDTLAVLKAAEEWLSDPAHWTQKAFGRNYRNQPVLDASKAHCTCMLGALAYVSGEARLSSGSWRAVAVIRNQLRTSTRRYGAMQTARDLIADVNDGPDGYNRVMAGLRKAIETLEAQS
jgi:hypothetical protein